MKESIYIITCLMLFSCGNSIKNDKTNHEESLYMPTPETTSKQNDDVPLHPETGVLKAIKVKDSVVNITINGDTAGHEYVDLGLPSGTLWATTNLGAKSAELIGNCYAWGETRIFKENKKYKFEKNGKLTKYCVDSLKGVVDSLFVLQPKDDAATAGWGPLWCMPTNLQMNELIKYCRKDILYDDFMVGGILLTSNTNGNKLFLPFRNVTTYWTSSIDWQENERADFFIEPHPNESISIECGLRRSGALIRPVVKNEVNIQKAKKRIDQCYNGIYPYSCGPSLKDRVNVDSKAKYQGGVDSLKEYIKRNTVYPKWAREQGIKGKSIIRFVVEKNGTLSHVDTLRTFNIELDKEAIRVVKSMKGWMPAKKGNFAVRSRVVCPVPFGTDE
ncbi:MAG: energy transducer TonB [Paludibacteraceae bacterium]|nr:energy transducer TonB [Paludibacteraceae bacterium]